MDEIEASRQKLFEMPGRKILANLRVLDRTTRIFARNSLALLAHLGQDDPDALLGGDHFDGLAEYVAEAERLLFNYLAATHARVEHMRRLTRYLWTGFADSERDYNRLVVETFAESPVHLWMIGLRNYMLHHELPFISGRVSVGTNGISVSISLNTAELVNRHDWTILARRYMDEHAPAVNVSDAVREYSHMVAEFDEGVAARYRKDHAQDLAEYRSAKRENEATFRRLTGPRS